jgi:hypothetical protein
MERVLHGPRPNLPSASLPSSEFAGGTIALPRETADAPARQASAAGPPRPAQGTPPRYNERKKFSRACWSGGDSISKLKITVLASEPGLA